jgi:hypothetical protein
MMQSPLARDTVTNPWFDLTRIISKVIEERDMRSALVLAFFQQKCDDIPTEF